MLQLLMSDRPRRGRLLVVSDDCDEPNGLQLAREHYEILQTEDGQHAIDILRLGDNPFLVDTILYDLSVEPGDEAVITYLRTHYPSIPVIVFSNYADVVLAVRLLRIGVLDCLLKPIAVEHVLDIIERGIGRHRQKSTLFGLVRYSTKT